ncbi:MAG: sigma 54-interacting transcriptional regulator [Deltaproteobacteria bacterium]|nr:sigma 54-interacting transcriptional regulator [Deltaproteobacteria bacterium]
MERDGQHDSTEVLGEQSTTVRHSGSRCSLLVMDGPEAGERCSLAGGEIRIGTADDCDLVLSDPAVSRHHLLVRQEAFGVWVQDLGSTNGTFFGDARVKELVVAPGGILSLGKTSLKVVPESEPLRPVPSEATEFHGVLGRSRAMREIFASLEQVAPTELTVLLEGETGTGKEAVAEAIHLAGPRREGPFVVVDCTTIPRELVESELFGHRKGAFTGALGDRDGYFVQADGGTVMLDEVGELPPALQPKLLRVLERREVRPVGAARAVPVDVRIIAATNRNLREEVEAGRFREDLFYRLATYSLVLPPLRERSDDIALLVEHFVHRFSRERFDVQLPAAALGPLLAYPWPGNVRELRNAVERAVALHRAERFEQDAFLLELSRALGESAGAADGAKTFKQAKADVVDAFERAYLADLLRRSEGNLSRASREAGIHRHHLRELLKKHGLREDEP